MLVVLAEPRLPAGRHAPMRGGGRRNDGLRERRLAKAETPDRAVPVVREAASPKNPQREMSHTHSFSAK